MLTCRKLCCTCIPQRWIFTILSCIGLCLTNAYLTFLSITIIEMVVQIETPGIQENGICGVFDNATLTNQTSYTTSSNNLPNKLFSWDGYTQGIILSSSSWSYMAVHFIAGFLSESYGGKHVMGLGIFIQGFMTFITPFTLDWGGSTALIITRILSGIGSSATLPGICTMVPRWSTPSDRTLIGNIAFSGLPLGYFFGNLLPPLIIKYSGMGWPAVFYVFGLAGMIWFPFWLIFVYEIPAVHPFITQAERAYLKSTSSMEKVDHKLPPAPWLLILKCKEFWAFTISWAGTNWALAGMMTGLPRYTRNVIKFSLEDNGYVSALPYIFKCFENMLTIWITEKLLTKKWMSLTNIRKLISTISTTGAAVFLVMASYAECDKTMVVAMVMIGITLTGSFYSSTVANPLDLSPNYAGTIMALGSGIASIVSIITPYLIGVLTPNSTISEWRVFFWMVFGFGAASNVVYIILYKAEVQPWNDPNFQKRTSKTIEYKEGDEGKE